MKTTWNYSRRLLPFFLCMLLSVFGNNAQTLPFRLSKGAGTFRLGVVCGNESCWLDQCSVKKKGQAYTIKDKLWKEGEIKLIVCPLTDSNGFIMEVSGERLYNPQNEMFRLLGTKRSFSQNETFFFSHPYPALFRLISHF